MIRWLWGCVRLGNADLDPVLKSGFRILRSNTKSENASDFSAAFLGFPFRSIAKSEKVFAKLFSWTVVFFLLMMRARARPLSNGTNENPKTDISVWSQRWNPVSDFAFDSRSFIHSFLPSFLPSFIHSFIHSFILSLYWSKFIIFLTVAHGRSTLWFIHP